ncbi:MAG: ribulokinase, partial [Opitutales bacterium]
MFATLGLDFGTNSVRALIVRCSDGLELGTGVFDYPTGEAGVLYDRNEPHLARQHPGDYIAGLKASLDAAIAQARAGQPDFSPADIIGIGV